jgi:hypothetical protein
MLRLLHPASRVFLLVLAIATTPPGTLAAAPLDQQGACSFVAGFQLLHDLIPNVVGACIEDEYFNVENGNAEQHTSGGLLVWRQRDNWTAFTNGATTWINGPAGVVSRANADRFPWELASEESPAGQPVGSANPNLGVPPISSGSTSGTPAEPTAPPAAQTSGPPSTDAPGPLSLRPEDALLRLEDMGKEISQTQRRTGSDSRGSWAEVRFERATNYLLSKLGPLQIYTRTYVAKNVANAMAISRDEVGKQSRMPEADKAYRVGGVFRLEGIKRVGDEQDSLSACSPSCNSNERVLPHQRTVFRYQNGVVILYFIGAKDSALLDADQANEWLTKLRERLG